MRTIIAGSRTIESIEDLLEVISRAYADDGIEITEVVCGGALGADDLGDQWAASMRIPVEYFLIADYGSIENIVGRLRNVKPDRSNVHVVADWCGEGDARRYNPGAGPQRNRAMAEYADALIALWTPNAKDVKVGGTASMILEAHARGLVVAVSVVKGES